MNRLIDLYLAHEASIERFMDRATWATCIFAIVYVGAQIVRALV